MIFCDLGNEPNWVYEQVNFIKKACDEVKIPFYVLDTHLYTDYIENFGKKRVVSIPFGVLMKTGKRENDAKLYFRL